MIYVRVCENFVEFISTFVKRILVLKQLFYYLILKSLK